MQWGRIISKSGLVMANEQNSRGAVVHRCFPEGGDSILSAFSWEHNLPEALAARQLANYFSLHG